LALADHLGNFLRQDPNGAVKNITQAPASVVALTVEFREAAATPAIAAPDEVASPLRAFPTNPG